VSETYSTWPHASGSSAIIVFVDRASMELTLKAARKAIKSGTELIWSAPDAIMGVKRYKAFQRDRYPAPSELLKSVDAYMTTYAQIEEATSRENAKKRAVPDEDGFITVTRSSKGGVRREEADEVALRRSEKERKKGEGMGNFYRFQMREKRKMVADETLRKFEEDKRRVHEMRARREAKT
jgi:hypothetical protein